MSNQDLDSKFQNMSVNDDNNSNSPSMSKKPAKYVPPHQRNGNFSNNSSTSSLGGSNNDYDRGDYNRNNNRYYDRRPSMNSSASNSPLPPRNQHFGSRIGNNRSNSYSNFNTSFKSNKPFYNNNPGSNLSNSRSFGSSSGIWNDSKSDYQKKRGFNNRFYNNNNNNNNNWNDTKSDSVFNNNRKANYAKLCPNGYVSNDPNDKLANIPFVRPRDESLEEILFGHQSNSGINFDKYQDIPVEASGRNIPDPIDSFADSDLHELMKFNIDLSGFDIPTPVQKSSVPIITGGRDLMACAQTGSGKTGAFLFPILSSCFKSGPPAIPKNNTNRYDSYMQNCCYPVALVLAPTRELAIQTLKFVKDFGKFTDLRTCVIVGGDNMEEQFSAIAGNPDIIIATPGRLMHLIIEMNFDLKTVQHVVFDEADRLFEMGFEEQLKEILFKLPQERQTILFSATLPRLLVDFAKAGLTDPSLIRLDVDSKMSKDLQAAFFSVKRIEKESALLFLLRHVIKEDESTIIFTATKHHVEYLHELLDKANIDNTYIYGSLDQTARKINISKFRNGKSKILIVTDVAARGIDIPLLENVINYDFPTSSKIFIHRVGRAARAGRKGVAYSFVSSDELPYFIDLQLFTGRPLKLANDYQDGEEPDYTTEIVYGNIPQDSLDMETSYIENLIKLNVTLEGLKKVTQNAYKLYYKTRAKASSESYIHAKELTEKFAGIHPILSNVVDKNEIERAKIVNSLSSFRPHETIFEVGKRGLKSAEAQLMQKRRSQIFSIIEARQEKIAKAEEKKAQMKANKAKKVDEVNEEELEKTFKNLSSKKRKREITDFKDKEYYMSHYQQGVNAERGYGINGNAGIGSNSFIEQMGSATMDLMGDDDKALKKNVKGALKWDTKKKRFIRETIGSDNKKRIKTESGNIIPASYKSKRFEEWQKKTKIEIPRSGEKELDNSANAADMSQLYKSRRIVHTKMTPGNPNSKNQQRKKARLEAEARREGKGLDNNTVTIKKHKGKRLRVVKHKTTGEHAKNELRTAVQITKDRKIKEKRREKNGRHNIKKKK